MNKLLMKVMLFSMLCFAACQKISVTDATAESLGIHKFDGTIYEYIEQGDVALGFRYDSLELLLNQETESFKKLTNLRDMLNDVNGEYTLFAMPDECFEEASKNWRLIRKGSGRSEKLSLKELFEYEYQREVEIKNPDETDRENPTIIVTLTFDYKNSLDTLVSRYIMEGLYDFNTIYVNEDSQLSVESLNYSYEMLLNCGYGSANGIVQGGAPYLDLVDTRETLMTDRWKKARVCWMDIQCDNGIVHVLTPGHEFGFGDFISYFKNYGYE